MLFQSYFRNFLRGMETPLLGRPRLNGIYFRNFLRGMETWRTPCRWLGHDTSETSLEGWKPSPPQNGHGFNSLPKLP